MQAVFIQIFSDYLGSQDVSFVPTNPSGTTTVEGTASVRLPTVIMQFFTFSELNLAVDCAARYDVGNADVTFVLDTPGPTPATLKHVTFHKLQRPYFPADLEIDGLQPTVLV